MMRIPRVISSVFAAGIMLASCQRFEGGGGGSLNKIELWYGPYTSDADPLPGDCFLIDRIERDLGISLVAVPMPAGKDEQEKMILDAARNNSLPDLFMVNRDVLTTLVRENKVARVDSMYAMMPERTKQMYDDTARASASFDGVSYGLSQSGSIDRNEGVLIRKDWLERLGLPVPVTIEDFYNVMRAFTLSDPDGDGIANTYGYGAYIEIRAVEEGLGCRFAPFFGAFGVEGTFNATRRNPGLNIHKSEYRTALAYVHRLVEERLIDPAWESYSKNDFRAAWKAGRFGIMREQNAALALESNYKDFDENFPQGEWILINPPVGPKGRSSVGAYSTGYRTYAVSRRAQELGKIPVIARLLEWMSTSGYVTVAYGEEGVNYMIDGDGNVTAEGLGDPSLAYTQRKAAPLLQLRNIVFYNSNEELSSRYAPWRTKNGREMSAFRLLREMQSCPWTLGVSIPGASKELIDFYEDGVRDFAAGRRELAEWELWLQEFDKLGGADWERRCLLYADENGLLVDDNIVVSKEE